MSGWGYGFWSPTQNDEALRAHAASLDERNRRARRTSRWERRAARWMLLLSVVGLATYAVAAAVF